MGSKTRHGWTCARKASIRDVTDNYMYNTRDHKGGPDPPHVTTQNEIKSPLLKQRHMQIANPNKSVKNLKKVEVSIYLLTDKGD